MKLKNYISLLTHCLVSVGLASASIGEGQLSIARNLAGIDKPGAKQLFIHYYSVAPDAVKQYLSNDTGAIKSLRGILAGDAQAKEPWAKSEALVIAALAKPAAGGGGKMSAEEIQELATKVGVSDKGFTELLTANKLDEAFTHLFNKDKSGYNALKAALGDEDKAAKAASAIKLAVQKPG